MRERLDALLGATFRIEGELGGGGMSRVVVAEELDLGRKVVIKVLPANVVDYHPLRKDPRCAAGLRRIALQP